MTNDKFRQLIQTKYSNKDEIYRYLLKVISYRRKPTDVYSTEYDGPLINIKDIMKEQENITFSKFYSDIVKDSSSSLVSKINQSDIFAPYLSKEFSIPNFNLLYRDLSNPALISLTNAEKAKIYETAEYYIKNASFSEKLFITVHDFISLEEIFNLTEMGILELLTQSNALIPGKEKVLDYIPIVYYNKYEYGYKDETNFLEDLSEVGSLPNDLKNFLEFFSGKTVTSRSFFRENEYISEIEEFNLIYPISFLLNYRHGMCERIKNILKDFRVTDEFTEKFYFLQFLKTCNVTGDTLKAGNHDFELFDLSEQLHIFLKKIKNGTINY